MNITVILCDKCKEEIYRFKETSKEGYLTEQKIGMISFSIQDLSIKEEKEWRRIEYPGVLDFCNKQCFKAYIEDVITKI